MADFGIKPEIALGAAAPKRTNISDLLGTATKAMEFSRLSELYPELIKKTTAEAQSAQLGAEKASMGLNLDKAQAITNGQVAMMFNPLVVAAAKGDPVDKTALVNAVTENARIQSKNAGIDWETQGKQLAAPYIARAENDPKSLQGYYKERMLTGLDQATRATMMTPEVLTTGFPRPVQRIPAEGIIRELPSAQGGASVPLSGQTAGAPPTQRDVIAGQLTQAIRPTSDPGFPLGFKPRSVTSLEPETDQEKVARAQGTEFYKTTSAFYDRAPASIDRVDRVLQTIGEIEKSREFKAGKAGELETRLRAALGEEQYKLLQKEIADLVIETSRVSGTGTDANTQLVAQSTGNVEYPTGVLKNVVTKLRGDAFGAKMQAQGVQAFLDSGFGEANLRNFRAAWNANADPRVFEGMAIYASDRLSPDEKKKAFDKIKPTTKQAFEDFQRKAKNLESLATTGMLPKQAKKSK